MEISPEGIRLAQHFEKCWEPMTDGRFKAYRPVPNDPPTIGWGSTGPDITMATVWSQEQCDERFALQIGESAREVEQLVKVPLSQGQFDALCDFDYNDGEGNLEHSTLLKKLNAGDYEGAADQFLLWIKAHGVPLLGLKRRRTAERAMFLGQDWLSAAEQVHSL